MHPGITLAVMVRDDAERLDRCIESVKGVIDRIVVLDTGSKDGSVAVAKRHGAAVQEIEWPENFSLALNMLLAMVETTWTLRLDSDEWFDENQVRGLKTLAEREKASGFYLVRRDLNPMKTYDEIHVLRLWRTHRELQYEGAVHEAIRHASFDAAWPDLKLLTTDIFFWHDGYTIDLEGKGRRNLELLRRDYAEHPEYLQVQAMLATTMWGMGEPGREETMEALIDRVLETESDNPPPQAAQALAMYMDSVPAERAGSARVAKVIQKALAWYPKNVVLLYYAGVLERKRGDMERALKYLLRAEARVDAGDLDRSMPVPSEFLNDRLWRAMGFIATQLGRHEVVARCQKRLTRR
jgi:hypothetical protein